jgi:iron-sulfur cluster repair protein YtfE (RIC family)
MNVITQDSLLAKVVRDNFLLFPVLNRLGVDITYKELSVKQVCEIKSIDINLFLLVVNTFVNPYYTPCNESLNFPLKDLMGYLSQSHKLFRDYYLSIMKDLFKRIRDIDPNCGVVLVNDVYIKAQSMFLKHINYEDEIVYPHIMNVCEYLIVERNVELEKFVDFSEAVQHKKFIEEMDDLLAIFLKYVSPTCNLEMSKLVAVLSSFSDELAHHMLIEDKYLYPRFKKVLYG